MFVFPGVGLASIVSGVSSISDAMFTVAAETLAAQVSDQDLAEGSIYPRLNRLRRVTVRITTAVVKQARDNGAGRSLSDDQIEPEVVRSMWEPRYLRYEPG